jgi:hypothetical protein
MKRLNYFAIPLVAVLLVGCQSIGGIDNPLSSDEVTSEAIPGDLDLDAAAEKLGVSSDDLKSALGEPPLDIPAAAEKLGVSETALRDALL